MPSSGTALSRSSYILTRGSIPSSATLLVFSREPTLAPLNFELAPSFLEDFELQEKEKLVKRKEKQAL